MPELPEVEVTRQSFMHKIAGARILNVTLGKPLRWPLGIAPQALQGRTVQRIDRRGKYLIVVLNEGVLFIHLGMSGSIQFKDHAALAALSKHDHFEMQTSQGTLRLNDPRRFGAVVYADSLTTPQAQKLLGHLGVEPLGPDFTPEDFYQALRRRSAPIKQVLLHGDVVVGVGNIYCAESLFRAGIRPGTAARRLSRKRAARLHASVVEVLQIALQHGGSTLRNYSNAQGKTGYFQLQVMVYGRAGEPCTACQTPIKKIVQGQRSSFYCPTCQS